MNKLVAAFFLVLALLVSAPGGAAAAQQVSIATNPVGMALFTLGASLSEVMKKSYPEIQLNVEATNGGIHDTLLLSKGEVEIGFSSAIEAADARNGVGRYTDKAPILGVFAPVIGMGQCPVLASSGISTVAGLKGKRVGVCPPGAMVRPITNAMLESEHMTNDDFSVFPETLGGLVEKMKNGQVDATLWFGVVPLGPMMDLAQSREVTWLPADAKAMQPVLDKYPHLFITELPAGTYPGQTKPVPAVAERYIVVAREEVSEDVVYKMVKCAYEHLDELRRMYGGWNDCTIGTALQSMSIPLHPGAIRYYREVKLPGLDEFLAKHPNK